MEQEAFKDYLKTRYEDQLDWYDGKAIDNQKSFEGLQLAMIVTSAMTPVILVSHFVEHSPWLAGLALLSAVLNLIIIGAMKSFQFQEHWLRYRSTWQERRSELYLYQAGAGQYEAPQDTASTTLKEPDKEALFVQKIEDILAREGRAWREIRERSAPTIVGH
jgi:Protein of unknown function (DUF4231)